MPRRFKGEIFRQSGVSYLVVGHDREQPDMLLVKTVNPADIVQLFLRIFRRQRLIARTLLTASGIACSARNRP